MCFVLVVFEIVVIIIFVLMFLGVIYFEVLFIGLVIVVVFFVVIILRMIKYGKINYGINKNILEFIMVGLLVDDIFVIVLFYVFLGVFKGNILNIWFIF